MMYWWHPSVIMSVLLFEMLFDLYFKLIITCCMVVWIFWCNSLSWMQLPNHLRHGDCLFEAWSVLTICWEVLKPIRFYGSWHWLMLTMLWATQPWSISSIHQGDRSVTASEDTGWSDTLAAIKHETVELLKMYCPFFVSHLFLNSHTSLHIFALFASIYLCYFLIVIPPLIVTEDAVKTLFPAIYVYC